MRFKRALKYLLFLVIVLSLGLVYSFSAKKNNQLNIRDLQIEFEEGNNNFLTFDIVNKLLIQKTDSIQNKAKSVIDLYDLENEVLTNPYVEESSVFLTVDGVLKTTVKQRNPIARVINKNESFYIDKNGVKIPLSNLYSARVVLVSNVKNDEDVKEILPLIRKIKEDNFLSKEIVGIKKMAKNYSFAVRSGDYKIDFGTLQNMDIKFKKIKAFYKKALLDETIHNYKRINVKYHNQVVCTK